MLDHKTATMTSDLWGHLSRIGRRASDRFDGAECAQAVPPEPTDDDEEDDE